MKIATYNINGIRAASSKGLANWIKSTNYDIYCFQETRATIEQTQALLLEFSDYYIYYNSASKKGYSGTAVMTKVKPNNVRYVLNNLNYDDEGRIIVLEYDDFVLVDLYTPNGGTRLDFKLEFMRTFLKDMIEYIKQGKQIIICTDFNISHTPLDLSHPDECSKVTGYLDVERSLFDEYLKAGFYDSYRELYPQSKRYTWSSYRAKYTNNRVGYLYTFDYIFVTKDLLKNLKNCSVELNTNCSDHYPVVLQLDK